MHTKQILTAGLCVAAAAISAGAAAAESAANYPSRPIRMLVPNAPGSSVDTLSRIIGNKMSDIIGQQLVIDNRAGAGGIVGMEIAKNAAPDGYTLISATTAASTVAVLLQKNPSFDPTRDYDYVSQFAVTANVLVVHPSQPVKSVKELISLANAKQGQLNMASAGAGSQSHLSGAYFMSVANMQAVHVPYKGGGPSVAAVIAGESHWTLTPAPAVMSHVNGGKVRAIGHSLPGRSPLMGNIPPIAETIPGFDYSGWQGFFIPKGTPRPIVEKLRAAVIKTANLPEVKNLLATQATEVVTGTPEEFRKVIADSLVKNAKVIKAIGLKAE
ncbi:MAG: tripartite tricarboxylate transporter substrate-binding protein [Burkholderiales bacterium]